MSQACCNSCGATLVSGSAFCAACGAPAQAAAQSPPVGHPQQSGYAPAFTPAQGYAIPASRAGGLKTWQKWALGIVGVIALLTGLRQLGVIPDRTSRDDRPYAHFVNSRSSALSAEPSQHYVDFSFDHPEVWQRTIGGSGGNFVQVAAPAVNGLAPISLGVGTASGTGNSQQDRSLVPGAMLQLVQQFRQSVPGFELAWNDERRVGRYRAYSIGYTGRMQGRAIAGRNDLIIPDGQTNGVALFSMVSEDYGRRVRPQDIEGLPEFRRIYESLVIGGDSTSPGSDAPATNTTMSVAPPPGLEGRWAVSFLVDGVQYTGEFLGANGSGTLVLAYRDETGPMRVSEQCTYSGTSTVSVRCRDPQILSGSNTYSPDSFELTPDGPDRMRGRISSTNGDNAIATFSRR